MCSPGLASYMTLGKSFCLSEPLFLYDKTWGFTMSYFYYQIKKLAFRRVRWNEVLKPLPIPQLWF